ncbi:hypothetical protein [Tautonia plasticadhaerens]|uniref:hypothetical protein n=1 Tax=Tautonia plasticadhaerens TaxID=2527974 RepID=UPI0011A4AF14|nr:hypothetical protein [Tautonia plasticadhaerens]
MPIAAALSAIVLASPHPAPGAIAARGEGQGEDGPAVVRLRVPASTLAEWFPGLAGLTRVEPDRFDRLVEGAGQAGHVREGAGLLRPMRVEHRARLDGGRLVGETTLRFPAVGLRARWAALEPWSPALESVRPESIALVHRDEDGRAFLRIAPDAEEAPADTTRTASISWTLRPRVEAEGRIFDLELIEGPSTALVLDLPEGITPSGPPGYREGPEPTGEPGLSRWRFDGPGGALVLRLRSAPDPGRPAGPWVGGPTVVELPDEADPSRPAGAARWSTSWEVDPGPEGHRPLEIALGPGVCWEDVSGPEGDVAGVEALPAPAGPDPGGTRLLVRWREGLIGPTRLTLSGLAPIDDPEAWLVPMAEPVGAQWTGGPVIVRLGPSWSLLECRERDGRRLDTTEVADLVPEAGGTGTILAFFADRPSPVAELGLAPASPSPSAAVRGTVFLRDGADAIEAEVDLDPAPSAASIVELELSPGWLPESIRLADGLSAPRWEQEVLPDGGRRLLVSLPGAERPSAPRRTSLTVSAAVAREQPEALALPRLRPIGMAVADERWTVLAGSGVALRPVEAEGLAWLPPGPTPDGVPTTAEAPRALLSWRWIAPEGRGLALREHRAPRPSAVVSQSATITGGRLAIKWRIQLDDRGQGIRSLPYRVVPAPEAPEATRWTISGADGRGARPVQASEPGGTPEVLLPREPSGPVILVGQLELPWDGEGALPVLHLPRRFETRGTVTLRVDPAMRSEVRGDFSFRDAGGSPRDPSRPAERAEGSGPTRLAASLMHDGPPGTLLVRTAALPAPPGAGVILRADLETLAPAGDAPVRHRLALDVAGDGPAELGVRLPPGASALAVSCNGRPIRPSLGGEALRVPLPRRSAGEPPTGPPDASCRVVIDYEGARGGPEVEAERPEFSIPCLSFSWRLAMPGNRLVESVGPSLRSMDPGPDRRGILPGLEDGRLSEAGEVERAMLDRLDEQASTRPPDGRPIGRVLASWDVGRWPLVVDRAALESRGIGPETPLPALPGAGAAAPADRRPTGTARRGLSPLGLLIVPIDTVLLVTTLDDAPRFPPTPLAGGASQSSWIRAVREAVTWGADRSDRFQSVEHWRSASRPSSPGQDLAVFPGPDARSVLRFVSPGWPGPGEGVRSLDRWPFLVLGAGAGLLLLAGAVLRTPGRAWLAIRVSVLLLAAIGSAFAWSRGGPRTAAVAVGVFYGAVIGAVIAPVRLPRRASPPAPPGSTVTRSHGTGSRAAARAIALLATLSALGNAQTPPPSGPGDPIVAFLVDPPEGGDEPDDADAGPALWLRDADLDRLEAASIVPEAGPPEWPRVGAVSADHELTPEPDGSWRLESRLTLRFEADGPAVWSLPIDRPTGLEASLDGRPRPVLIGPGPGRASVAIGGAAGLHTLTLRQRVRPEADSGGLRLAVPVNPVATAGLSVADPPGPGAPALPNARGPSTTAPDGRIRSAIGPVDRVEVSWDAPGVGGPASPSPRVEGLLLWRAMPSADRLDARLTVSGGGPIRELWFAIEPGVAVRSIRASGSMVEGSRILAEDGDRWVARIDPPLPDGGVIQVELWRPRPGAVPGGPDGPSPGVRPPRLEPIGVDRFEGKIALMRPESWSGRLSPLPGGPPLSEQEFEQEWGPLPRGAALDPAGAARFLGAPAVAVPIGPTPSRLRVTPTLQLDLDAGRWEWRLAAEVLDVDGRPIREMELGIPRELELLDVAAPGLTAWDRPARDRLRLRFDGPASPARSLAVGGWIPQPCGPMDPGPLVVERPLPWPQWPGASERPGKLLLSSPTTALIGYLEPDGEPVPVDRLAPSNNRRPYREIEVREPGMLRVESFPSVTVELWSQLSVNDRSARWDALLRFEVVGGPADRIELDLPDAWVEGAEYELDGFGAIGVRDLGDHVEVVPERPIWGVADLRIRSLRSLASDQALNFPDLVPWSRQGTFSRHTIALVAPTDRAPIVDFSGLEPADPSTRDRFNALFTAEPPADSTRTVYSVLLKGWSLAVRPPSASTGPDGDDGGARVAEADLSAVVDAGGTVRGHAAFELVPSASPFLVLLVPGGAVSPAAVVDGRPVLPRIGPEGRWVVPLGDGPTRRVELVWIDPAPENARRDGRRFSLPQAARDGSAALISLRCDEEHVLTASAGSVLPTPAASPLVDRMRRTADRIRSLLGGDDAPPDGPDRDAVAAEVARFLSLQRQAERSAYWAALMRPDAAEVVRQRGPLRRIVTARQDLEAELAAAGLPDLISTTPPGADPGPPADRLAPLMPGVPHHFRAETEAARPITFEWTRDDDN